MEVFSAQANSKVQYTLTGASSQILSISMKNGDIVHSEPGTMMMMSNDIKTGLSCNIVSILIIQPINIVFTNRRIMF